MKDIEKAFHKLVFQINKFYYEGTPIPYDAVQEYTFTLLETQALALEGKEKGIKWMQEGSNKNKKGFTEGYNLALQQAADHLRAQKITE